MPAGGAEVAIEEEQLSAALYENAYEILNIMASLFNGDGAPHVRLDTCYAPGEALPGDVAAYVLAYVRRLDLDIGRQGLRPGTAVDPRGLTSPADRPGPGGWTSRTRHVTRVRVRDVSPRLGTAPGVRELCLGA